MTLLSGGRLSVRQPEGSVRVWASFACLLNEHYRVKTQLVEWEGGGG